jgi:hypothetical protein
MYTQYLIDPMSQNWPGRHVLHTELTNNKESDPTCSVQSAHKSTPVKKMHNMVTLMIMDKTCTHDNKNDSVECVYVRIYSWQNPHK